MQTNAIRAHAGTAVSRPASDPVPGDHAPRTLRPAATGSDAARGARAVGHRPNIVLVVTDDQNFNEIAKMPQTKRLRGARMQNAIIENPLCCPARATILSGQYSPTTGVEYLNGDDFDDRSTVATWLKKAGYRTSLAGKYLNEYPFGNRKHIPKGWTDWHVFNDQPKTGAAFYNYALNDNGKTNRFGRAPKDYSTDVIHQRGREFIKKSSKANKPFFLMATPFAPHEPTTPAPRHRNRFKNTPVKLSPGFHEKDLSDKPSQYRDRKPPDPKRARKSTRAAWRSSLAVDDMVGGLRRELKRQGQLKNTIFMYMSDQGYSMGQHRWFGKVSPYEESVKTPLIVSGPGIRDRAERALMSNADIAPTIAGFAGAKAPKGLDGRNMAPVLREQARRDVDRAVLLHQPGGSVHKPYGAPHAVLGFWGLRTERFKYIETKEKDGSTFIELYDLKKDPHELESVSGTTAYADVQANLEQRLATQRRRQESRRP